MTPCPACGCPLPAFPSLWVTTRTPSTECCSEPCARAEQGREITRATEELREGDRS